MMLSAGIETTTDFDPQLLHFFILFIQVSQASLQFRRQSAAGGDTELTGVGSGAGGDVQQGRRAVFTQAQSFQSAVQFWKVRLRDPAQDKVLINRGPNIFTNETASQFRQLTQLITVQVPQRQSNGRGRVSGLFL